MTKKSGRKIYSFPRKRRSRRPSYSFLYKLIFVAAVFGIIATERALALNTRIIPKTHTLKIEKAVTRLAHPLIQTDKTGIKCNNPYVIDGDTLDCGGQRIRLANIDAPEMPGHCRPGRQCTPGNPYHSRDYLRMLAKGTIICQAIDEDVYGRTVALCKSKDKDLSCAMIKSGHAVSRYGELTCI